MPQPSNEADDKADTENEDPQGKKVGECAHKLEDLAFCEDMGHVNKAQHGLMGMGCMECSEVLSKDMCPIH
jgi:hypothetical protein